ncbi:hypothetical protein L1987_65726 [Smallanthus sonchifolius]|uniref:Uncharacterized protein n=1 Tax=Smallanthus sonchifolius TaxID=185202 RepID=A0ACB9BV99_9ASTR|nr:hypothetical protein L1987_65726 [Smallanthus sonchifolius]
MGGDDRAMAAWWGVVDGGGVGLGGCRVGVSGDRPMVGGVGGVGYGGGRVGGGDWSMVGGVGADGGGGDPAIVGGGGVWVGVGLGWGEVRVRGMVSVGGG